MKRGKILMAVLVMMAVLFASCSNGLSENTEGEGGAAAKAVAVRLALGGEYENVQKAISLSLPENYTYFITATPQWTSLNIQNPFPTETEITYIEGENLGYFTPGMWTFDVTIKNKVGNNTNIVYTGTTTIPISPAQTNKVAITMTAYDDQQSPKNGKVTIKVAVPKVGDTKLFVKYDTGNESEITFNEQEDKNKIVAQDGTVTPSADPTDPTDPATNWYYFHTDASPQSLSVGTHTVYLIYKDGNTPIGGATVAFTVRNGDEYGIYGTIEEGQYQIATLNLKLPGVTIRLSGDEEVVQLGNATTSISATVTDETGDPVAATNLKWYLNGASTPVASGVASYSLSRANAGRFEVVCVATNTAGNMIGYAKKIVTIKPVAILFFRSQVDGGPNVSKVDVDGSLVCTATNATNAANLEWYVDGTKQTAGVSNGVFTFGTASTTKTDDNKTVIITCKEKSGDDIIGTGSKEVVVGTGTPAP